jgi:hypothetical protein
MSKPDKDNPAFPVIIDDVSTKQFTWPGLTKREYFALHIYSGMMHTPDTVIARTVTVGVAVRLADELLHELSKERE